MKITNYSVSYHWSDNTYERVFVCADDPRECGNLDLPEYLLDALEKYAKELEQYEEV